MGNNQLLEQIINESPAVVSGISLDGNNVIIVMNDFDISIIHVIGKKVAKAFNLNEDNLAINVSSKLIERGSLGRSVLYAERKQ